MNFGILLNELEIQNKGLKEIIIWKNKFIGLIIMEGRRANERGKGGGHPEKEDVDTELELIKWRLESNNRAPKN